MANDKLIHLIVNEIANKVLSFNDVSKLVSGGITANITNTFLGRESSVPGIWIDGDDNKYSIGIRLNVYYGVNVPQLSYDIQSQTKKILDRYDINIDTINIIVEGIDKK